MNEIQAYNSTLMEKVIQISKTFLAFIWDEYTLKQVDNKDL